MAIKSIISAGQKSEKFEGAVMTVGAANSLKLNAKAMSLLGVNSTDGGYAFIANDEDDTNVFYIATGTSEKSESGARGSKLTTGNPNRTGFTHAVLGKTLFEKAAVLEVSEEAVEFDGLQFHTMTILQTREEAAANATASETAKQEKVNAAEDAALAGGGRKGRASAE